MTEPVTTELSATASDGAAAIIDSTRELVGAALDPQEIGTDVVRVLTPPGWVDTLLDLETYVETPRRKRSAVTIGTTESLARYLNTHRAEGTTLYADADDFTVTAIIDDHSAELAGHRDHRATLQLEQTPGAARWIGAHGKYLTQEQFAQLIEDGIGEIASPDGATLLEVVQTIHSTNDATFRSGIRLQTGQVQFSYVENLNATAGAQGDMEIPEIITLVFEPFYGSEPIQINARLRYRISQGTLTLGVWLIRHVEEIRKAFDAEVVSLADLTADAEQDGLTALIGTA